ncbi:MAG: MoxR family ATPase [Myxococcota bacterium]
MGERTVSIDGVTHELPDPFMVLATQNPLEHHGTYPLPESQRDRFTMRLSLGYAGDDVEAALLAAPQAPESSAVTAVSSCDDVRRAQAEAAKVFVHPDLAAYAQRVVAATRDEARIRLGVSTRGALAWIRAARARAWLEGRAQVSIDDLQELAVVSLAHRVVVTNAADAGLHAAAANVVADLVATVPVPR